MRKSKEYFYKNAKDVSNISKIKKSDKLIFLSKYNEDSDIIPKNITELGPNFHDKLEFLPDNIEILKVSYNYDKEINDLPASIKKIYIDKGLEFLINPIYHSKIKYYKFNKDIDKIIKENIKYIKKSFKI